MTELFELMHKELYAGNAAAVESATRAALETGMTAAEVLEKGLIGGMDIVGRDFKAGELFIPEVLMCASAMHAGLSVLKPLLADGKTETPGTVVLGTVEGDLHDIGKNLVGMMLEGAGFTVVDLGASVTSIQFLEAAMEHNADVVGMSALLTTTMQAMGSTIEALEDSPLADKVKVIIGGAPVTAKFAEEIGADRYAADAGTAVEAVRELLA